jgi:hypothetical protein
MMVRLGCVVEGNGEEAALPILIRRIAERIDPGLYVDISRPVIIKRSRLAERFGELERGMEKAIQSMSGRGAVFVLLDSDDDLPCQLGPALLERVKTARPDLPSAVVLAKREYEAWFLAAAESLGGKRGLPDNLQPPSDPEAIQGAKEWLRRHWPKGRKYNETTDQPALTALFDMDLARSRSDSFDKCYREIERLLRLLLPPPPPESPDSGST